MKIQILGSGCPKCKQLTANAEAAVRDLGVAAEVEKITDLAQMMQFGVMMTPALAIDGEVKASGKVLSPADIKKLLQAQ